ncbi:helix-turn-helix transcriptional regulator [Mycobacterium sp. MBM]|nr:helix-turn-helix transcriptional regulator [Mycobacterium sp. MBM]
MLGLLGDEWTLLIVQQALLGASRYGEFVERLPISHAVLTRRLVGMVEHDLMVRRQYRSGPPRFEYLLTARGQSLWPVLISIWHWERRWVPEHALPAMRHAECGKEFAPVLTCRGCGAAVDENSLVPRWGPSGSWPRSMPAGPYRRRSHADRCAQADLFPQTMNILGNRWAFAIMVAAFVGTTRFTDFAEQLGAPPGSLTDRLQVLTANGVLDAADGGYRLSPKGRATLPIILTALAWAQRWYTTDEGPAVLITHSDCGASYVGVLSCGVCAAELRADRIIRD